MPAPEPSPLAPADLAEAGGLAAPTTPENAPEPVTPAAAAPTTKLPRPRRWLRRLAWAALASPIALGVAWWALHAVPGLAPWVADTLRAMLGTDRVAALEEFAYGVQDRWNRTVRAGEAPKAHWDVPPALPPAPRASGSAAPSGPPPFAPKSPGPLHPKWAAPGDGTWVPLPDPRKPADEQRMFKTLLHPDPSRSWAEVFVVAVDLRRAKLFPVIGYQEPVAETNEGLQKLRQRTPARPARVPEAHTDALLAAFNGGFKAEHGHWGMFIDGVVVLRPKPGACTLAELQDGSLRIGTWKTFENEQTRWYRQTPPCMVEGGKLNPMLVDPGATSWGATLEGDTVIRRSAVGLDPTRGTLFVAISNDTTARAMAIALQHVGATDVAQLDVNWSYPKFLTFQNGEKGIEAVPLAKGFEFTKQEYVNEKAMRDFFYLARRELVEGAVPPSAGAPSASAPSASASASAGAAPVGSNAPALASGSAGGAASAPPSSAAPSAARVGRHR